MVQRGNELRLEYTQILSHTNSASRIT